MERRTGSPFHRFGGSSLLVLALSLAAAGVAPGPARAATPFRPIEAAKPATTAPTPPQAPAAPAKVDRLVVDAKQLVYDKDNDTVTALGNVQLYYQGRILEADKVTYDRKTSRVFAEGNAKLTETDGTVAYGDRFELTDDFKTGFIDSLSAVTRDKTYFTAPRSSAKRATPPSSTRAPTPPANPARSIPNGRRHGRSRR